MASSSTASSRSRPGLNLAGQPEIALVPLHHLYAADPDMIDRIGAVSVPAAVASWAVRLAARARSVAAPALDSAVDRSRDLTIAFGPVGLAGLGLLFSGS